MLHSKAQVNQCAGMCFAVQFLSPLLECLFESVSITYVIISLALSRDELDYDSNSTGADVSKLPFREDGGGAEPGSSNSGL